MSHPPLPPMGELAARWFAEREEPGLRGDGMPDDGIEHLRQYVINGLLANPQASRAVVEHYWRGCSCDHLRGHHKPGDGPCTGRDSYGQPCGCPSFELSQEEREQDEQEQDRADARHHAHEIGGAAAESFGPSVPDMRADDARHLDPGTPMTGGTAGP